MPIYQLAHYQVKAAAVEKVKAAIQEFVAYLEQAEPGARLYWGSNKNDSTRFVHIFEFADDGAHERHGKSEAVHRFEAVLKEDRAIRCGGAPYRRAGVWCDTGA